MKIEVIGYCPICDREMWKGDSIDKHHFVPKSQGGKKTKFVHKICHSKIHSLFSEKELALFYNTPQKLKQVDEIKKFIKWVSKKDPDYYDRSIRSKKKRKW